MEFPHLADTDFPNLQNANPYAYKNDFDYTRWTVNTKVRLTNVLWNGDYKDVVLFDTNDKRDKWFDSHTETYDITLTENKQIPPEGGIKLPIPYDVAARYNYLVVDIPVMPGSSPAIAYEDEEAGIRRWFYFIDSIESRAPNTTAFNVSLDVWMQYQNDIDIRYMYLERGHAPVAATDVDEYLANPIENNAYLLTPDVTPSSASVVRHSEYVPFGNGTKYICIASTCAPSQLASLGSVIHGSSDYTFGNITYSDIDVRYGYQLQVNGYGIGNGDDYSNLRAPSTISRNTNNRIPNNVSIYAVSAADVYGSTFFSDIMDTCPQFMNTVQGCFMVDRDMIYLGGTYSIAGHTIYEVRGTENDIDVPTLDKSMFAYPERYQRFAKLYTFPYATIELTDNDGKTATVRIENTGDIHARLITELAFPYVNTRVFFTGINGTGSDSYTWKALDGTDANVSLPRSDWFDYCFDHEIPCYALYMDAETAWYLDNFNGSIRSGRQSALVAYHNAARNANTARENAVDSNATVHTNVNADASTYVTNTDNTANTNRTNADVTIAANTEKVTLSNTISNRLNEAANKKADTIRDAANDTTTLTTASENETTTATTRNSILGSVGGAVGNAAAGTALAGSLGAALGISAAVATPIAVGALLGVIPVAANAISAGDTASAVIQANNVSRDAAIYGNDVGYNASETYNNNATSLMNIDKQNTKNIDNRTFDTHTNNNNSNMRTNANNTANTMRNNATRTNNTGDNNANWTRLTGINNAKETLENSRRIPQYGMYDARNRPPRPIGSYAGDPTADYMRTRGVQCKVRTMPDAEVRQVGDWFARYGYTLNQVWDVSESGLCPMKRFCYWNAVDVWIDDRRSSNNVVNMLLSEMFERGVTVWKDPEEVGRVNIYDN